MHEASDYHLAKEVMVPLTIQSISTLRLLHTATMMEKDGESSVQRGGIHLCRYLEKACAPGLLVTTA